MKKNNQVKINLNHRNTEKSKLWIQGQNLIVFKQPISRVLEKTFKIYCELTISSLMNEHSLRVKAGRVPIETRIIYQKVAKSPIQWGIHPQAARQTSIKKQVREQHTHHRILSQLVEPGIQILLRASRSCATVVKSNKWTLLEETASRQKSFLCLNRLKTHLYTWVWTVLSTSISFNVEGIRRKNVEEQGIAKNQKPAHMKRVTQSWVSTQRVVATPSTCRSNDKW
jgi:hypothetical protein